jgi:hydroxyacylglutathione hydrolase
MLTRDDLVTSGAIFLDGGTWDVDSNVWISDRLLVLDPVTGVHTGHGPDTTIGAEAPDLPEWIARGD